MSAHISAARAVTAIFFQRLLKFVLLVASGIMAVLIALTAVLAVQLSNWWWLLLVIIVPIYLIAIGLGIGLYALSNRLMPRKLTSDERTRITDFTSKVSGLVETAKTPYPLVAVLVAKDVLRGKRSRFLEENVLSSRSIKSDFQDIQELFK
ncbi:MAG: hypothetical protein ABIQ64_01055 [Candidatus Saccharimonadales bacterium]